MRLSYVSLYQKLMKLNGELSRWQSTYQQLMENSMMTNSDPNMARLKAHYENMTCEFLNVKSTLLEPELLCKLVKFVCSTSSWLVYLAIFADANYETANELKQIEDTLLIRKPTDKLNLSILAKIPEYFFTNVVEFLIFCIDSKTRTLLTCLSATTFYRNVFFLLIKLKNIYFH